jgi:membrane-associated protease RseP (regulator of RpoE activity)
MGATGWWAAAYVAAWLLGVPITLLHELGHALTALALGVRRVTVQVGRAPTRRWSAERLELRIRLLNSPRWAWFGTIEAPGDVSTRRAIAITAAGPIVTAAVLASLLLAAALLPWPPVIVVWVVVAAVAWQLLVTAIPMRYPRWFGPYAGRVSDGYRIVRLLRSS